MKVLLINPSFTYENQWLQITEPLGILYLASYLKKYSNHTIEVLDCISSRNVIKLSKYKYWYGLSYKEILSKISICQPDIVGLTCLFSKKRDDFLYCARVIRGNYPNIILLAGGTYPSLFPNEVMQTGLFDYCIIGEGEQSLKRLADFIADSKSNKMVEEIDGLAYTKKNNIIINPKKYFINDLDSIPFPSRDLIDYENYITRKTILHGLGINRSASILTSRSCPNRCNFCSMFKIHGSKWRGRSAQNIINEILHLKELYNIKDFFIMDDNFTFNRNRIIELCNILIEKKIKINWNTPNGVSTNTLDEEILLLMKKSGCYSICIAIETGNEELRNKVIGKRLTNKKIEEVTECCRKIGLLVNAFYIIGMPGENKDNFKSTIEQIKKLHLNGVAAAFANPLPGTKLYQDCLKNNWTILNSDERVDNVLYRPFIITSDFSEKELILRERRFYRTFFRSKFFTIIKDTMLFRNKLLYPPFLLRIIKDRLFRN